MRSQWLSPACGSTPRALHGEVLLHPQVQPAPDCRVCLPLPGPGEKVSPGSTEGAEGRERAADQQQ